jgi:cytochrome d ubiquinol oxidase subunit II
MAEYFRRRAVASAIVVAVIATAGAFVLHADAAHLFDGLTSRALPVAILSGACGVGALLLLVRGAARGARVLAVVAVAAAVVSWGVAQSPYILPQSLTFAAAAAPSGTLTAVLAAVVLAAVVVLPGFVLLYVLDQRGLLPEEGVDDVADHMADRVLDQRALGNRKPLKESGT